MLLDKIIEMGTDNEPPPLTAVLRQCVLLASDSEGALYYSWQSDMVAYYQESFIEGCVLMSAWQEVPKTAIAGVLDTALYSSAARK
jgi:hypothetical protein